MQNTSVVKASTGLATINGIDFITEPYHTFVMSPSDVEAYGFYYPVTFEFTVPPSNSTLKAWYKYGNQTFWQELPQKTSNDFFNGIEVARFDETGKAYISKGFCGHSKLFIKITDADGDTVSSEYVNVTNYYDNRQMAVTSHHDDYGAGSSEHIALIQEFQKRNLWYGCAVITGAMNNAAWLQLQNEVNEGYVEVQSHSRTHARIPDLSDYRKRSEIGGSKEDILTNITGMPYGQYVLVFIFPYSYMDNSSRELCGEYKYIVEEADSKEATNGYFWEDWRPQWSIFPDDIPMSMGSYLAPPGGDNATVLNSKFDEVYDAGGIYELRTHPAYCPATASYVQEHLDHIAGRKNVWYTPLGHMYAYRYVALFVQHQVSPKIWTVDDDGSAIFSSIQEALNSPDVKDEDVIYVHNGTYYEHVVVNKTVSLIGENRSTTIIDGNGTTCVVEMQSSARISGFTIQNGDCGVKVLYTKGVTISGNEITGEIGIDLCGADPHEYTYHNVRMNIVTGTTVIRIFCSGNNIVGNIISGGIHGIINNGSNVISGNVITSNRDYGIMYGENSTISGNNITNNGICGIAFTGYSTITGNFIANNGLGMDIHDNNVIVGNTIISNGKGIRPRNGNVICHNFVDNGQQVGWAGINNTWDDGYPSGGNYWSNYTGVDVNGDGIGDTPYVIDSNNTDRYPLMNPWTPPDIAVMNVIPAKSIIGQGFTLPIHVTVTNQGNKIEGFNVVIYANTTFITSRTITLTSGSSTTITFTWDTTGISYAWPYPTYTISATATPVPGETDVTDNTYIYSAVQIAIPGDANGDGRVRYEDLSLLTSHWYGHEGYGLGYNPAVDFNMDGKIRFEDLSILVTNWYKGPLQ